MQPEKLLTIQDVAERLQVGRHKASDLINTMPFVCFPGCRTKRVREKDFQEWLFQYRTIPAGKAEKKKPRPLTLDAQLFEPDGRLKRRQTRRTTV